MTHPPSPDRHTGDPDPLEVFLAQATRVEPERLPTADQLLWRAEILARLESEDRRAERAVAPLLAVGAVAAALAVASLTLLMAGIAPENPSPAGVPVGTLVAAGIGTLAGISAYALRGAGPVSLDP